MYFHEPTYALEILTRQNLHIHTTFSRCAKPEMTPAAIVAAAEAAGLAEIAMVNHQNYDDPNETCLFWVQTLREETAQLQTNVKILLGMEFSCYGIGKTLENDELRKAVDYRLFACNHYHVSNWEHPADRSPRGYAKHAVAVIRSLLESGKADCIAHPFTAGYIFKDERREQVTAAVTDNELGELFELAVRQQAAFEINPGAFLNDPVFSRRMWNLGRETGLQFNVGTDAHQLSNISTAPLLEGVKAILA